MSSRAHRWKGDDHPLTGVHGGTREAARRAIQESKEQLYQRARAAVKAVIERNKAASECYARKDRRRPRAALAAYEPMQPQTLAARAESRSRADLVWDACNGHCVYCGWPMYRLSMGEHPDAFSIDHDIPKCRGGTNALENLVGAHKRCNNEKGALTGAEYRLVLERRARS